MDAVTVRRAMPAINADVAALAMLRYTWRVDERGESGHPATFATSFESWWHDNAGTHCAWLAERDGAPVGMVWLAVVHRVPGPEQFRRVAGILQSAYVLPAERGLGTGSLLVTAVIGHARGEGLEYVTVHPSERSYPLYRRAGFTDAVRALELGLSARR